jgi:SAM-dependent methyltransferase
MGAATPSMPVADQPMLALHDLRQSYAAFGEFQPRPPGLLEQGGQLSDCVEINRVTGLLEPLTGDHIPPDRIRIQGSNFRESLIANRLLSRNRAVLVVLVVLEQIYGSIDRLRQQEIDLVEALTGFVTWLSERLGDERLHCSEYLEDAETNLSEIPHQDLYALTFPNASFDLALCNELFEHVQYLELSFEEIARVLKPGGRLVAICPQAFGQVDEIVKVRRNPHTGSLMDRIPS